jgi:diguanylate cyclase (GGDEF)-like protein
MVFRYGGEEFAIILPATDVEGAANVAERIRRAVDEKTFEEGTLNLHISASVGGATCGVDIESVRDLILKSDRALYAAKQQGKNRVVMG